MNIIWATTSSKTSHNKCKRKKSNIFVNEKMVIKSNHNKSIFKVISNDAFFKHGKKNNDIVVMAKGNPIKTNKKKMLKKIMRINKIKIILMNKMRIIQI